MQTPCSLQLGPCGPSPSLGEEGDAGCLQQREESKQLFERFWKGTFKAVASPRPGSVIVASITARRRVTETESRACQTLGTDDKQADTAETRVDAADRNGCIRGKGRKRGGHHRRRARSPSSDEDLSPRPTPKAKKKKRKSERKRKRKRSPSYSLSPPRKKKKKKKKRSSKKSKRHRYTSKKSKHSSSSLKRKRKEERKHKKSTRSHSHRRRRYRRSESDTSTESRHLRNSVEQLAAIRKDAKAMLHQRDLEWRPAAKSVCRTTPNYRSHLSTSSISSSKPGDALLRAEGARHRTLPGQSEGPHDYDSGNDTSSPPSSKTGLSRMSVTEDKRSDSRGLASPEKPKFPDGDNASDSGNSVTSYVSLCKTHVDAGLSDTIIHGNSTSKPITLACRVGLLRSQRAAISSQKRLRAQSSSSRSRSRSSGSSRYSGRCSRSQSLSSGSLYSRSQSYSADVRRRGSAASSSSRGSYSRYSPDRVRRKKRKLVSRERDTKHTQKGGGKKQRRKSYSPMRKRRRDSPSHLEARRITSARKRPIPYFRPSPSSNSRSSSVSSWSSLFTRSRSRSPVRSASRSRSRSRSRSNSYSSYRSYSRSSSWNSIFGTRSRSRSHTPQSKHSRVRH